MDIERKNVMEQVQQNFLIDTETLSMLEELARLTDRSKAGMLRSLIRQEYARHYSQPTVFTVGEAVAAQQESAK